MIWRKDPDREFTVKRGDYHGWPDAYFVSNGIVEAVVVPAIGRIMQFRFAGSERGVFWENRALDGAPGCSGSEWRNFGGDKVWPAPQEDWTRLTGRAWPPPSVFDSEPNGCYADGQKVTLISPLDRCYGIQVLRHVVLRPGLPVMEITTRYCKVFGPSVDIAVWVVTQLRDPQCVLALLPKSLCPEPGYRQLAGPAPLDVGRRGRVLSLRRDPDHNLKIAIDCNSLAWIDDDYVLRIDAHGAENGCSAAVYTNMDPLQYVELETEGRVARVMRGDSLELTNTYTLACRSVGDITVEAFKAFGLVSC